MCSVLLLCRWCVLPSAATHRTDMCMVLLCRLFPLQEQTLRDIITSPRGRTRSIVVAPEVSEPHSYSMAHPPTVTEVVVLSVDVCMYVLRVTYLVGCHVPSEDTTTAVLPVDRRRGHSSRPSLCCLLDYLANVYFPTVQWSSTKPGSG